MQTFVRVDLIPGQSPNLFKRFNCLVAVVFFHSKQIFLKNRVVQIKLYRAVITRHFLRGLELRRHLPRWFFYPKQKTTLIVNRGRLFPRVATLPNLE